MLSKYHIETLARGVYLRENQLLYCHSRGAKNIYLPGGHVEFNESATVALARDLDEELGIRAEIGHFLGAVEHAFIQKGKPHAEINLVFAFSVPEWGVEEFPCPVSREKKIDFGWTDISSLETSPLEPAVLRPLLPRWIEVPESVARWGCLEANHS